MTTDTDGHRRPVVMTLAGRYHLEEQIGSGGAGSVWRAYDELLGRPVAIKRLHPELERDQGTIDRFRREATAAAALTHPNAVIIYDIGHHEGQAYLVMELVDGPTLADLLERGPLPSGVTAAIGLQIARALGEAHERGLVHRDIKPANVLLTPEGQAKVADFGIAKALGASQTRLTTPGMIVGTAAYLAPEQLRNAEVDARADVYSLGLVLHECLTGEPPFGHGTAVEVAARRLADDVPPPSSRDPDVEPALDEIISATTRLHPDQRYSDGGAVAASLEALVGQRELSSLAATVRSLPGPRATDTAVLPEPQDSADDDASSTQVVGALAPPPASGPPRTAPRPQEPQQRPPQKPRKERRERRSPVGVAIGALLVVAVVFAVVLLSGEGGQSPDRGGADPGGVDDGLLTIEDGGDWDPHGDGREHPQDVPNAFDGSPDTRWQTERYDDPLSAVKPEGVGIWFDVGEATRLETLELDLSQSGADVEIYVYESLPDPPGDLGEPLGRTSDLPAEPRIDLEGAEGRYVLVWFTELPHDGEGYRIRVSDARIEGG